VRERKEIQIQLGQFYTNQIACTSSLVIRQVTARTFIILPIIANRS